MRLVVAVIKPAQMETVRLALAAVQVTRLTVCDVHGYDREADIDSFAQEVLIEIAVNDDFLDRTVDAVGAALAAGGCGGRLFVLPMHEAVQIYREVRGPEAV
ncbi:MAG: P-II family nitrogen regulator [Pirellulales bacterium]